MFPQYLNISVTGAELEALETMTASATGSERSTLDAIISRAGAALDYVKAHNAAQAAEQAWEASENPKDQTSPEWAAVQAADKAQEAARIAYTHTQQN